MTSDKVAHRDGILVRPWNPSDKEEMVKLIKMGVDGIATDFPDILRSLVENSPREHRECL
jgi:glycerophosphoryl diester phosphodiesterase